MILIEVVILNNLKIQNLIKQIHLWKIIEEHLEIKILIN